MGQKRRRKLKSSRSVRRVGFCDLRGLSTAVSAGFALRFTTITVLGWVLVLAFEIYATLSVSLATQACTLSSRAPFA